MIQDHHLDRVSRSNSLMTYWGALGLPSDLAKADGFQRQNILTWDSVAGLAPELIAEQDVISYFGDVAFAIEHCLRDCLLPASKRWSGLVESRAE